MRPQYGSVNKARDLRYICERDKKLGRTRAPIGAATVLIKKHRILYTVAILSGRSDGQTERNQRRYYRFSNTLFR